MSKNINVFIKDNERYDIEYSYEQEGDSRLYTVTYDHPHLIENIGESYTVVIGDNGTIQAPQTGNRTDEGIELMSYLTGAIHDAEGYPEPSLCGK